MPKCNLKPRKSCKLQKCKKRYVYLSESVQIDVALVTVSCPGSLRLSWQRRLRRLDFALLLESPDLPAILPSGRDFFNQVRKSLVECQSKKRNSNENKIKHTTKANSKHAQAGTNKPSNTNCLDDSLNRFLLGRTIDLAVASETKFKLAADLLLQSSSTKLKALSISADLLIFKSFRDSSTIWLVHSWVLARH